MLDHLPVRSPASNALRRPALRVALVLIGALAACGDDDGAGADAAVLPDAAATDGSLCGEAPLGPAVPECQRWACAAVAYPECWSCAFEPDPALAGSSCTTTQQAAGTCVGGTCEAVEPPLDPGDPGDLGSTTESDEVTTTSGDTVPLTIYVPEGPGPFPVVVLTHGFQLGPELYASYGEHLASWGFVAVLPSMPGSLFTPRTHTELKVILAELIDWLETANATAAQPLFGLLDLARLALAGHSMGGKISLLVATEDDRPQAVFGIDPVDAAGGPLGGDPEDYPSVAPELMAQITVPLVLLGETVNATAGGLGQACAPAEDNFHQYFIAATSPALEIEVLGANHMSFLDDPDCGVTCSVCPSGTDDPAVTRRFTQRYLTAFLLTRLGGAAVYADYLTGAAMQADVTAGLVTTAVSNGF